MLVLEISLKLINALQLFVFCFFLRERKNELEGEIFEMLLTFSDFLAFKEMFLDYRAVSFNQCLAENFQILL
jgi:hypothetical protein